MGGSCRFIAAGRKRELFLVINGEEGQGGGSLKNENRPGLLMKVSQGQRSAKRWGGEFILKQRKY